MTTEVIDVSKTFGDFEALKSVSLTVQKGEFIAILGPSGCGKTTLLRLVAGFDAPTAGEIKLNGETAGSTHHVMPPEKRNIGMVFQSFALWPHLTVREQVEFPIQHHPHARKELKARKTERAREMLSLVGLEHLEHRMPGELSGGQKQRVALARALAHEPALLLMDEPLSSLDAGLREEMRREIQGLHRATNSAILYVTHDQGEALAMADRIVIMKGGRIEQIGTPEEVFLYPQTSFVANFVGKASFISGNWEENVFHPEAAPKLKWGGKGISESFKQDGVYPVRPDQWMMSKTGSGIPATVTSALYQGKHIHYTVKDLDGHLLTVYGPSVNRFKVGERVSLLLDSAEAAAFV